MKRTTRVILTLSLTAILLGATASAASATRTLSPTSTDYGNREVGTTSPAQAFTLRVKCTRVIFTSSKCLKDTFSPSISITSGQFGLPSSQFAQTNNCPSTMTDAQDDGNPMGVVCTIIVTFTPTSIGPKVGTLRTGSGGPTAALAGSGVTTPTPPTPPTPGPTLTLDLDAKKQELKKKVKFFAQASEDASMAVGGGVKVTERELVAGERRKVKAKPKNRGKLVDKLATTGKAKVKVQAEATSESGDTDRDKVTIKLRD
jgi:hypothetical protein